MSFVDALPESIRDQVVASLAETSRASGAAAAAPLDVVDQGSASAASDPPPARNEENETFDQAEAEAADPLAQKNEAPAASFRELLEPLEAAAGKRLSGPGRRWCEQAYGEDLDGFARCVAYALRNGREPLALLCQLVRDGDHLLAPPPPPLNGRKLSGPEVIAQVVTDLNKYTRPDAA